MNQEEKHVEVNIPSSLIFERVIRASAAELGEALEFPKDRIEDLKLAVSEAVTNAIEHGNKNITEKLVAVVFVVDQDKLEVRIADQGEGYEFDRNASFPHEVVVITEETLDERTDGGFGLSLIRAMVDHCEVTTSQDGTVITLRIYRKGTSE
jgi:serine/threonine-protein kinase RsbW